MTRGFRIIIQTLFAAIVAVFSLGTAMAQSWSQLSPIGGPPSGSYEPAAIYDPATKQMIVFGGSTFGADNNDLWALSLVGSPTWTLLSPAGGPPAPRVGAKAVYDAANTRMVVFGGGLGNTSPCADDVWVLSNANGVSGTPTWSQLAPSGAAPGPRWVSSAVYDPVSNRMTVFGGNNCFSGFYNDVWVLSNANGLGGTPAWTQLAPAGTPPSPSGYHTAVYDSGSNRMIVFGVFNSGSASNQVWVLTNANGLGGTPTWIQLSPAGSTIGASGNQGAVYDLLSNRMIVFGANNVAGDTNEVWVLANANGLGGTPTWSQLSPSGALPAAREGLAAVYDPTANDMIIFGGSTTGTYYHDAWILANANGEASSSGASLVSYWPLDGGSAVDLVGGNNGTTTNTTGIAGLVNGALHFDGVDSIVSTPYAPSLDASKMAQLTAETWARFLQNPPVVETFLTLIGKYVANGPWSFLLVVRQHPALNGGQPFFTSYLCNSQQCLVGEEAAPYANVPSDLNWHHVAESYDSATGTVNLYVDGALARTWALSPGALVNDPNFGIQIGSFSPPGNYFYTNPFDLDEVALWGRALSPSEILCHYQAGLAGKNYFTCPTPTQVAPTVSFTGAPASAAYGATFIVSATTNASTTASISASGACSVSGATVTMASGTGTCSLTANWAADSNYTAASLSQSTAATTAPFVVTVASTTKILNAPNPALNNVTYRGFVFSDGPSSLGGTLACTTTATTTSSVGSYPITCSGLTSSNYAISYTAGTLKILYAPAGGTCDGDLSHTILQPVNADGTSVWKQGRTIPVKFRVCDANGVSVGSAGVISSFALTQIISGTVTNVDETIDANVADAGFRFDTSAQQWIFNLSTKSENAGYTYVYTITLNDGTSITFQYGLK